MRRCKMSKYTAELRTIIENNFDIFDFTYTRSDASKAIISDKDLEQGFIDRYYFREVGFETLERFKHKLKTQWLESIGDFDKLLVAYNQNIDPLTNMGGTIENVNIFNDTPKNALDFGNESTHATSITNNKQTTNGYTGVSQIELLEQYHNKIKDIQSEFYDSFDNLFMQIF